MKSSPRVLITAGPTHEPIDAVRYLANRSSGRMGLALAEASLSRNWPTTLLLGPVSLPVPHHSQLRIERFQTTADLQKLLRAEWPEHDVLFMAAAVADYRPVNMSPDDKIRRGKNVLTIDFESTPDLLADAAKAKRPDQFIVGFALESEQHLDSSARKKLSDKGLDAIVANPPKTMDAETIAGTIYFQDGHFEHAQPETLKSDFSNWLLDVVSTRIRKTGLVT